MAVDAPNLNIEVDVLTGCTGLQLIDNTGQYDATTNPFGYGLPAGPTSDEVLTVTVELEYGSLGTSAEYVFTVDAGEITACTLSLGGVTPVDIFDQLTDFVWPFTSANPFDLTKDRGVTMPTFADDAFTINYTIEGTSPDDFSFTSATYLPVGCNLRCCIDKKWQAINPTCGCCNDKRSDAMYLESLYQRFFASCVAGSLDNALTALREAQSKCDTTTGGCGC